MEVRNSIELQRHTDHAIKIPLRTIYKVSKSICKNILLGT